MSLQQNQFAQIAVQGQLDLDGGPENVVSCLVDNAVTVPLVPGQAVKLSSTAGGPPHVLPLASNSDAVFGFVVYSTKDINFPANSKVEIALFGSVMHMTSGGAIARGASVEVVYNGGTGGTVITTGGSNPVVGFAFGTATGSGQLLRVYIQSPFGAVNAALNNSTKSITVTSSLAQINAGMVLIPGVTGQKITVLNYIARVTGTFATGTSVELESTNASPVAVSTIAEAGIAGTTVIGPFQSNTTLGAGFGVPLGTSDGLQVVNNGTAQTGGTSIQWTIEYVQQ